MAVSGGLSSARADEELTRAYSSAGAAWADGPSALIYDQLADLLVTRSPVAAAGGVVVDLGAGTGAASRAAQRAGAGRVVAVDPAAGMLAVDAATRPPAVAGDARAMPIRSGSVDLVVAAFCLNHVADPVVGLREIARMLRPGGGVVSGTYAADDGHPVKAAVETALGAAGWTPPDWYRWIREHVAVVTASTDQVADQADRAGLTDIETEQIRVPFPHLDPVDLVRWRMGMAQHAAFVAGLDPTVRDELCAQAVAALGPDPECLVRSVIVLSARSPERAVHPAP